MCLSLNITKYSIAILKYILSNIDILFMCEKFQSLICKTECLGFSDIFPTKYCMRYHEFLKDLGRNVVSKVNGVRPGVCSGFATAPPPWHKREGNNISMLSRANNIKDRVEEKIF